MQKDPIDDTTFYAFIPSQKAGTTVRYYIKVQDKIGSVTTELPGFVENWDTDSPKNTVGIEDKNDDSEIIPDDIDVLGLNLGYDEENIYLKAIFDGTPGQGNLAKQGAFGYFIPLVNLNVNNGAAEIFSAPMAIYAPIAAGLLGIPKYGVFRINDLMASKKEIEGANTKMKKNNNSISFSIARKALGENISRGVEFMVFTTAMKSVGEAPVLWEASPFLTVYFRHHEINILPKDKLPENSMLRAGAAEIDITPPVGTPLAGYAHRWGRPSTGAHDPLKAQALVIESNGEKYVFITADFMYVMRRLFVDISKDIEESLGIVRENIVISASHAHHTSGALFPDLAIVSGKYSENVYKQSLQRFIQVIKDADSRLRPAQIGFGVSDGTGLSNNRREPGGPFDPEVNIMKIDDESGKPIAIYFNFTAHPTLLDGDDYLFTFSADFPGYARKVIEDEFPGVIAMFVNGAQGNQGPDCPSDCGIGYKTVERVGSLLGKSVAEETRKIKTKPQAAISFFSEELVMNPQLDMITTMTAVRIDDVCMISVPGEMFAEYGLSVKKSARELGFRQCFILGLTNDGIGYIVPEEWYHRHVYEAMFSIFGPKEGEFIHRRMLEMVKEISF
ncbi:MAG: neutral/alkaline non-lysosomal ceramidase N-terminal domain-containing protein [bacterium]